ncbi:Oidioi.mRNA.OKI2018_I69.PAR.g12603.t1.cds [Oikopleura dioica]|uniref:Oidioi.mRNA.OKI2018_I69.PAR.g12603.t1.cds n=2 Tax=Oikopleura dioica TaxID=34765 RepID=A0ABN7S8F7_OIKDI|nr:Oidioi.mRNA.OKI2018_I69.PAR.g12603.t1.cds [Oikopleura dioica]
MSFAKSKRTTYFDDVTKNKENLPGPERYNPQNDHRVKGGFQYRDQSMMDISSISGAYQTDKSILGPPQSTPSKEPFKIAKRGTRKSTVSKSLEMSMSQEMAKYKELESDHFQLKQRYQKISDLKDELEEDYTRVKEEAQKVPRLQKQLEALQDSLEISKTKGEEVKILEDQLRQLKEKEDETFKQITEKESQLVTLRGQIVALEGRITESETTLKNKSDELQKANLANFNLEHRIAELEPLKENVALLKEDNAVYAAEINGLKQTLEEAHKTLKIKESENTSLKQNIGSQVSETDSLVKKLEQMRFERDECKALEKDLREVQGTTEAKVRELMASVAEKVDQIKVLEEEIRTHQTALTNASEKSAASEESKAAQIHELSNELAGLKENLSEKSAELEEKLSENQKISEALENLKAALLQEEEKLKEAEEIHEKQLKANSEARDLEIAESEAKISELQSAAQAKDLQISQFEESIKATAAENVQLLEKIEQSDSAMKAFEEKLNSAESAQSDLSSEIARLKAELEEAKAKNVCSSEEFTAMKEEVSTLRAASKDHEAKFVKIVNEKREIAKEAEILREHGAKYKIKRDNLRAIYDEQLQKTEQLELFKKDHEGTLTALQQKLKAAETEKQNFRAQLTAAERKLADATDRTTEIEDLHVKLAESDAMCEKWKAEYEELENFYAPIRADLAKFAEESRHWGSENEKKSKELAALNSKLADQMSHANHKQKIKYMNKIKDENELLKTKLSFAECQMKKLKKENDALRDDLNVVRNVRRFDPKKAFQGKQ